jgi:predicted ATPase
MQLTELSISGFKTIKQLEGFQPRNLNVFIGANGAGKSNFLSFFRFMNWMMTPPGQLQFYVGSNGGAGAFLSDGPDATRQIAARIDMAGEGGPMHHSFRLAYAANDTLRFAEERYKYTTLGTGITTSSTPGNAESELTHRAEGGELHARAVTDFFQRCVVHHFHNTTLTSRMKQRWNVDDNQRLKEDAGNLAPFLLRLCDTQPQAYQRIVATLRQVAPFFADFVLKPVANTVILQWRELGTDAVFGASQASDGLLRVIALLVLLLQPERDLPEVLLIDEPELGLHPQACETIAGILRAVSLSRQVFVATQSAFLVDQFEPDEIVVVDRPNRNSTFRRLSSAELADWVEEFEGGRAYSLSELWEKNVLGGSPTA